MKKSYLIRAFEPGENTPVIEKTLFETRAEVVKFARSLKKENNFEMVVVFEKKLIL